MELISESASNFAAYEEFRNNELERICKVEGLKIVVPDDHTLQVDLDTPEAVAHFNRAIQDFEEDVAPIGNWSVTRSRSTGWHATVKLIDPATPQMRIFYQLLLGSDYKREFLNMRRVKYNDPRPILFLEKDPQQAQEQALPVLEENDVAF